MKDNGDVVHSYIDLHLTAFSFMLRTREILVNVGNIIKWNK